MTDSPQTELTGLGHYRAAAALLVDLAANQTLQNRDRAEILARAQVHATLALAAATAINDGKDGLVEPDCTPWHDAVAETTS